jgi:tetratricopeptide (TPR) repeat protein
MFSSRARGLFGPMHQGGPLNQGAESTEVKLELRLARLAQSESTGLLEHSLGKRRRRFWLRDGKLVASSSNLKKEQPEQVAPTLPDAAPETINEHVAALRLAAAMAASGGKVRWKPDEAPKREFPARLRVVVFSALELAFETHELSERLDSEFEGYPMCKTQDVESLASLELPLAYREWLVGLDGYRSVFEVSQFGPGEPRSCVAGIYLASICGALEYRQRDLERPEARPTEEQTEDGEILIDDEEDESGSTGDIASLIAASVTPLGGGEAPAGPGGFELEVEDEGAEEADGDLEIPYDDDDDIDLGDEEIPFEEDDLDDEAEHTDPGDQDWGMDAAEASLRAEIHRILESENVFEVLSLGHESEVEDFRTSYFRLARILHPDRVGDDKPELQQSAAEAFDRARAAWEIVKDDELREETIARVIHGKKSEEEEAMEAVQEMLAIEKSFDRGLAQFRAGRIVQAHEMFAKVLVMSAKHPDFEVPEFRIYMGYCLWRLNHERDEDEASRGVEMLQNAMNKAQSHQEGWVLLGRVVKQRGHPEEARKLFIRALKLNPENKDALREMERLKRERGGGKSGASGDKPKGFLGRLFSRGKKGDKKKKKGD